MPHVNHDANVSRLHAKYGVEPIKTPRKSTAKKRRRKRANKLQTAPVRVAQRGKSWIEIHREHQAWKKTEGYRRWRHAQFLKQGGTCYYCDMPLNGSQINDEHIIPKSRGGDNRRSNLVLACWQCNKEKYTKLLPKKDREELKKKNKQKRGTYHELLERYPTEEVLAERLADMFREG